MFGYRSATVQHYLADSEVAGRFLEKYILSPQSKISVSGLIPSQVETDDISATKSDMGDDDDMLEESEKSEEHKLLTSEHLAKLYVFALTWGMGAYLDADDRLKYDVFLKENLSFLDLPINDRKNPDVNSIF